MRAARAGDGLLRSAATVGSFTAAGRICGYAREIAVAAVLGAGPAADAFFLALRVPGFMRKLFAGRGVGAVFIPMFMRRLPDRHLYARVGACAAASALMAGALWLARLALGDYPDAGGLERIVGLGVLVAAGLGCFAVAALATGAVRWRELGPRAAAGK